MDLQGKVAVVTGAGSGIGEAIASRLAQAGARVSLFDIAESSLERVQTSIFQCTKSKPLTVAVDVRCSDQINQAMEETVAEYGGVDILVTAAGVPGNTPFLELDEQTWDRVIDINLKGTYLSAQAAARHMVKGGRGGRIITIASINSFWANRELSYCASKGGVAMLTRSMAVELGRHGITVNAICPGVIETPLNMPIPEEKRQHYVSRMSVDRIGTPQDVAGLALYLASDESAYMTGSLVVIDGGLSIQ